MIIILRTYQGELNTSYKIEYYTETSQEIHYD